LSYLNGILTANAVLLAALTWTNVAGGPASAMAAPQSQPNGAPSGPPLAEGPALNSASQRLDQLNTLRQIRADLARLEATLSSGKVQVRLVNPGDIKLDIDYSKLKAALKE
jgi:hypothetical protein